LSDDDIIDGLIRREGSTFTDHPLDAGGPTKFGITLRTLREERGAVATPEDVKKLTEEEAREIYRRRYIRRPGFWMVKDDRLRALLVDFGVNSGPKRAVMALQAAVGTAPDGKFGPETLKRLDEDKPEDVYRLVLKGRLLLYVNIVIGDPSQLVFLRGWANRLAEFF